MALRSLLLAMFVSGCATTSAVPRALVLDHPVERVVGAPLGTDAPYALEHVDPAGRWLALCAARRDTDGDGELRVGAGRHGDTYGDELRPFLVLGSGEGVAIDAFVGADPKGRFVAVIAAGRLLLLDVERGHTTDLSESGADVRDGTLVEGPHRAASFDGRGAAMIFIRRKPGHPGGVPVLRELDTGAMRELDVGPGHLRGAYLSPSGHGVLAIIGIHSPRLRTSLAPRGCRGPISSYSTWGFRGPAPRVRAVRLDRGDEIVRLPRKADIEWLGDHLLIEPMRGEAYALAPDGRRESLPVCERGRGSQHNGDEQPDPARVFLEISCWSRNGVARYHVWTRAGIRVVGAEGWGGETLHRYLQLGARELLDIDTGKRIAIPEGRVLAIDDAHVLLTPDRESDTPWPLEWIDVETGERRELGLANDIDELTIPVDHFVVFGDAVVDLAHGELAGRIPGRTIAAIGEDGHVLTVPKWPHGPELAHGPLRWDAFNDRSRS